MDRTAAGAVALRLPWCVLSLILVGLVAALLTEGDPTTVVLAVGGFLLSGALMFLPASERVVARVLFRLRRPAPRERARLADAWHAVTRAASVDGTRYRLRIERSGQVNAYALAGRTVAVTRAALTTLPPRHLEAVLAHELGHHLGGHPWTLLLMHWYAQPARLALWLTGVGMRTASGLARLVAAVSAGSTLLWLVSRLAVGAVIVVVVVPAARGFDPDDRLGLLAVLVLAPPLLLPWLSRVGEVYADRAAADLGYGAALVEVLDAWVAEGHDVDRRRRGWWANVFARHPAHSTRIRRLERHLARRR